MISKIKIVIFKKINKKRITKKNLKLILKINVMDNPIKVFLDNVSNAVNKIDSDIEPEIIFLVLLLFFLRNISKLNGQTKDNQVPA